MEKKNRVGRLITYIKDQPRLLRAAEAFCWTGYEKLKNQWGLGDDVRAIIMRNEQCVLCGQS